MIWKDLITGSENLPLKTKETLDTLESIIEIPDTGDRHSDIYRWFAQGVKRGILQVHEALHLRRTIAPHI
jgi:hypothetical protein